MLQKKYILLAVLILLTSAISVVLMSRYIESFYEQPPCDKDNHGKICFGIYSHYNLDIYFYFFCLISVALFIIFLLIAFYRRSKKIKESELGLAEY
jgi:NADH:ubiquinone oxidoreductase subunit 2 (subunit N)